MELNFWAITSEDDNLFSVKGGFMSHIVCPCRLAGRTRLTSKLTDLDDALQVGKETACAHWCTPLDHFRLVAGVPPIENGLGDARIWHTGTRPFMATFTWLQKVHVATVHLECLPPLRFLFPLLLVLRILIDQTVFTVGLVIGLVIHVCATPHCSDLSLDSSSTSTSPHWLDSSSDSPSTSTSPHWLDSSSDSQV